MALGDSTSSPLNAGNVGSKTGNSPTTSQVQSNPQRGSKRKSDLISETNEGAKVARESPAAKAANPSTPASGPVTDAVPAAQRPVTRHTSSMPPPPIPTGPKRPCMRNLNTGNTREAYLQAALTNSRNANAVRTQTSALGSQLSARPPMSTGATSQFGHVAIQPSDPNVWNPSMGPTPASVVTNNYNLRGVARSQASNSSRRGVNNGVCKLSGYTKQDFRKGDIISLPYHTANSNPNVDPKNDPHWTQTIEGPAYSKRRMVVVMWLYDRDMFCLPLYTFNGCGLAGKKHLPIHEYVSMKNVKDEVFVNQDMYPPVEVEMKRKPMDKNTTVWITGGSKVACNEDIAYAGRMTRNSHNDLLSLWKKLWEKAEKEPWRD